MRSIFANIFVISTALALMVTGCVDQPQHQRTPLEIQSLQTREYESSKKIVFPSVMSVLQDLGYTIKGADKDTGFINANSATHNSAGGIDILGFFLENMPDTARMEQTAATAFIEEIGARTRVRLNFVVRRQTSSSQGQSSRRDTPILDVKVYTNAFERIENAIFIRSGE